MRNLISTLSLGRLADGLARAFGWSPVGRRLEFTSVEGPLESGLRGRTAQVIALMGEDLVVQCSNATGAPTLRLRPRHRGWTARSLLLASISVVAQAEPAADGLEAASIAVVRIAR